jgi:hypothetical protein
MGLLALGSIAEVKLADVSRCVGSVVEVVVAQMRDRPSHYKTVTVLSECSSNTISPSSQSSHRQTSHPTNHQRID